MDDQTKMTIPLFNGNDHEIWSIKMRTLLMSRNLWDVVENGVSEDKDLKIKDMTALHLLHLSVTDSIFLRIGRATSSKQAWELLKNDYGETAEIQYKKKSDLGFDFRRMRMTNEENVDEYIDKFMDLVNRARFYGDNITDDELINLILRKLPSRFNDTVYNIRHRINKCTIGELFYFLRKTECLSGFQKCEEESSQNYKSNKRGRR